MRFGRGSLIAPGTAGHRPDDRYGAESSAQRSDNSLSTKAKAIILTGAAAEIDVKLKRRQTRRSNMCGGLNVE